MNSSRLERTRRTMQDSAAPPQKDEPIRILFFFNQHTLALFREAVGSRAILFGMRVLSRRDRLRNYLYTVRFIGIVLRARLQNTKLEVYIPHTRRIMKLINWISKKEDRVIIDDGAIFLHTDALSEISRSNIKRCITSSGYFWPEGIFDEIVTVPRKAVHAAIVRHWESETLAISQADAYFIDNGRLPYDRQLEVTKILSEHCEHPVTCLWHPSRRKRVPQTGGFALPAEVVINRSPRNTPIFGYDSTTMFNLSAAGFTEIHRIIGQTPTSISNEVFASFGIRPMELKI